MNKNENDLNIPADILEFAQRHDIENYIKVLWMLAYERGYHSRDDEIEKLKMEIQRINSVY